ncbi:hypothetical protein U5F73_09365, partial [Stenotrophomonas pavanii]|uniref:hypothetical protein n=2 Tax=Stenotrophomonas TaxID=40323 RepID=UPI002ACE6A4F
MAAFYAQGGFRQGLQPCTCRRRSRSKIKSRIPWDGGAVWVVRTRRKPIHGGSMAPSMAPTVLP